MFYSVTIPGILPVWLESATWGVEALDVSPPAKGIPTAITQRRESVHPSMATKRPVDSQDADSASFSDDTYTLSMLYERFRRPIHSYTYRLLGSQEDADDVTQEVFVRVFNSWDRLHDRGNLSPWLYRIATNLCVDLLRRRKRISWSSLTFRSQANDHFNSPITDESLLPPDNGGIPEVAEREHIRLAIASMPEEYAIALVLNAAQGVPYQEIATVVGISPNAAATRISRAKKMFAEHYYRLSQEGVGKQENSNG